MCKWYIGLFSGYEQISLLSVLNFRMIAYNKNEIDFITCDHNKSVIQYICILCNLPFSIDKEISNKQNIIKEVFNTSSNAAITAKWINKEVLTY